MTQPDISPLLSLVVPTRNRQEYAISLLQGIRAFEEPELEVIVQDNSDDDSLGDFVSDLNDSRVRYYYSSEPMNMHQNWDLAVEKAIGHYVCLIGDDDGIFVPSAMAGLRRAKSMGADAILTEMYIYSWPGTRHRIWGEMGGPIFSTRAHPGVCDQRVDPGAELAKLFDRGSVGGLGLLPRVYQGFVARASLVALMERAGTCFPGGSPDMANAVGLVPFVKKMLFDPTFTIISGHSPRSGGGQGVAGQHHGELEQAGHLPSKTISNWDPRVPRFWSGLTIYAQSALDAAQAVGLSHRYSFNYLKVCVACLIYEPKQYRHHIYTSLKISHEQKIHHWPLVMSEYISMIVNRIWSFARNVGFYYLGLAKLGHFDNMHDIMVCLPGVKDKR